MRDRFPKPNSLIRSQVRALNPYVPGEQPLIPGLIKLNTNENPYPPAPAVLAAVKEAADARLRLYPNPSAQKLRERLALFHNCSPENIIVGNGSDELLALATRAFVEPASAVSETKKYRAVVQYFYPGYSLYPVLADIHGAIKNPVKLTSDFKFPDLNVLRKNKKWIYNAALTYITTPNAPSGRGYATEELEQICMAHRGVVILDEAYVDFAQDNALSLALKYPHIIVSRTFSKAYSLCFLRVGYFIGNPTLIAAMHKIRDSYNVNGLGQIAALVTLDNIDYYKNNFEKIKTARTILSNELTELGFKVFPSQTNFILAKPPIYPANIWLEKLREKKILVRWFNQPEIKEYLRITIGKLDEVNALIAAAKSIINGK
ncbi:MAG: histidinol-phosphate transaminase [Verrucomicrobiia bacterium]